MQKVGNIRNCKKPKVQVKKKLCLKVPGSTLTFCVLMCYLLVF